MYLFLCLSLCVDEVRSELSEEAGEIGQVPGTISRARRYHTATGNGGTSGVTSAGGNGGWRGVVKGEGLR